MSRASWQMRLPFPWMLALRYLRSTRRHAYVSLLSVIAIAGIGLGVGVLILLMAAITGLQSFLRSDVLARTPHLEVELPAGAEAAEARRAALAVPGVVAVRGLLRGRGWLVSHRRAVAVEVIGFEGELPHFFPEATDRREGLYLAEDRAVAWGLAGGEPVDLLSPRPTLTPLGPQPRVHRVELAGTFRAGRTEEGAERVAVPLTIAGRLFGEGQLRLEVEAEDLEAALDLAPRLREALPAGSRVRSWNDLNRPLFFALRLEKALMFSSLLLIVGVAVLAVATLVMLLIASKRSEIGMLQAMGARVGELRQAFILLGACLALIGLAGGSLLGTAGAVVLDRYRLISLFGDSYYLDHVPFILELRDVVVVQLSTLALTLLSAAYGAHRVTALEPVEALRR